jgi:hypothetical protein
MADSIPTIAHAPAAVLAPQVTRRRTAEQGNEFPPFQLIELHFDPP